jgi:hypothetical protein
VDVVLFKLWNARGRKFRPQNWWRAQFAKLICNLKHRFNVDATFSLASTYLPNGASSAACVKQISLVS